MTAIGGAPNTPAVSGYFGFSSAFAPLAPTAPERTGPAPSFAELVQIVWDSVHSGSGRTGRHPSCSRADGTVARKRFWCGNFLFAQDPALGGPGFRRFRPVVVPNGAMRCVRASP